MQRETLVAARQRQGKAEGTSTSLEKQYMRLTSAPDRSAVRPPVIIEKALQALKDNWLQASRALFAMNENRPSIWKLSLAPALKPVSCFAIGRQRWRSIDEHGGAVCRASRTCTHAAS